MVSDCVVIGVTSVERREPSIDVPKAATGTFVHRASTLRRRVVRRHDLQQPFELRARAKRAVMESMPLSTTTMAVRSTRRLEAMPSSTMPGRGG